MQSLIEYVACDVVRAVRLVLIKDQDNVADAEAVGFKEPRQLDWLKTWVAQLTFTLTVDEKSQINPGVAINQVLPTATTTFAHHPLVSTGQTFSMGLAAAYSADATRKETLTLYIPLSPYTDDKSLAKARAWFSENNYSCPSVDAQPDFKTVEWLSDVTLGAYVKGGVTGDYSKDLIGAAAAKSGALSHQVTFVVIYSGGATPMWKLVNFTGSTTSPLFGAQRTNTQDVIITLGPPASPPSGGGKGSDKSAPLALGTAAENTTLAALIGISVANQVNITQINIQP